MLKEIDCNLRKMQEIRFLEELMQQIEGIRFRHYKLSYRKAHYAKCAGNKEKAKTDIDEAISLLDPTDNDFGLVKCLLQHDVEWIYIAFILCVKRQKVYELAGQIHAQLAVESDSDRKMAILNYQKFLVLTQQFKTHKSLENMNEVTVYSFRPFTEYALSDLANNTITVCHPSKMNDPFDSVANLWKKTEHLKSITQSKGHEELLGEAMDYFRIRSFVLPNEDGGELSVLRNIKMWSSYACNHTGFCIKYRLKSGFIKRIDEENILSRRLAPVKYVKDYEMPKSMIAVDSYEAYNIKHECWAYENEIRLLSYNTTTDSDFYSEPMGDDAEIDEIIFGILCPEENRKTIYNLLKSKNVKFSQMTTIPENTIYRLEKVKYE